MDYARKIIREILTFGTIALPDAVGESELKTPDTVPEDYPFILGPGEEFIVGALWIPRENFDNNFKWIDFDNADENDMLKLHACLDVRVYPLPNEPIDGDLPDDFSYYDLPNSISDSIPKHFPNNWAYENIGLFEVSKGSPYGR